MLINRFEQAEPYLRQSLQYDPRFAQAHYRLGLMLARGSNVSGAVEELQRAAALDQSYPEPLAESKSHVAAVRTIETIAGTAVFTIRSAVAW